MSRYHEFLPVKQVTCVCEKFHTIVFLTKIWFWTKIGYRIFFAGVSKQDETVSTHRQAQNQST